MIGAAGQVQPTDETDSSEPRKERNVQSGKGSSPKMAQFVARVSRACAAMQRTRLDSAHSRWGKK